jgi:hypothetical protein
VLFYVVGSTSNQRAVTAEAAGSSPAVPAKFLKRSAGSVVSLVARYHSSLLCLWCRNALAVGAVGVGLKALLTPRNVLILRTDKHRQRSNSLKWGKHLLYRAHREKKPFVDFRKFDEAILSVECARRFVFRIYNDSR